MFLLLLVSLIWAFSFGLIKTSLGNLDYAGLAVVRIGLATLLFVPFLRWKSVPCHARWKLLVIGAVQFGAMYLLYLRAFRFLQAYEVALFTLTTPLYIALLETVAARRLQRGHFAAAVLAVIGASVVVWRPLAPSGFWLGLLLVQVSNVCFAFGQLAYRRIRISLTSEIRDTHLFALPFAGALALCLAFSFFQTDWAAFRPAREQWIVLVYLGLVSSGLCFFWWNVGATRVNAGTLAVFNNAKIPLGVAVSLLVFGEKTDLVRLIAGGSLLTLAVWIAEREAKVGNKG